MSNSKSMGRNERCESIHTMDTEFVPVLLTRQLSKDALAHLPQRKRHLSSHRKQSFASSHRRFVGAMSGSSGRLPEDACLLVRF